MKHRRIRALAAEIIRRGIEMILPVITAGLIAAKLGPASQGRLSAAVTMVSYFVIICQAGIRELGICIAASDCQTKEQKLSGLLGFQICSALVSAVLYLSVISFRREHVYLIQTVRFLACALNVSWLAEGMEEFGINAFGCLVQRLFCCIFALCLSGPGRNLLNAWALVTACGEVLRQLAVHVSLKRKGICISPVFSDIACWLHDTMRFAGPLLAMHVFSMADRTFLAMLAVPEEGGYYACADRMVHIPFGLISGTAAVLLPEMIRSSDDAELFHRNMEQALRACLELGAVLCGAVILIAEDVIRLLYGSAYLPACGVILLLCPLCILKAYTVCFRNLYLIPKGMQAYDLKTICIAMAVNASCDLILVPRLGAAGAAAGTVLSELTLALLYLRCTGLRFDRRTCLMISVCPAAGILLKSMSIFAGLSIYILFSLAMLYGSPAVRSLVIPEVRDGTE